MAHDKSTDLLFILQHLTRHHSPEIGSTINDELNTQKTTSRYFANRFLINGMSLSNWK